MPSQGSGTRRARSPRGTSGSRSAAATPPSARILAGREQGPQPLFPATALCTRALYDLYTHPAITAVLRVIVGPEVTLHGISVIRVKLPEDSGTAIPWHQDSHYYNERKRGSFEANTEHMRVITTWVPLVDSNLDNGCLWVIPGSHRWGFLAGARAATGHVQIPEDVERRGTPTPLPMRPGDVVFLTNLTLHASKVNGTDRVRWSHDFRYHPTASATPPGTPEREATDYLDAKSRSYGTEPLRRAQCRPHADLGGVGTDQPRAPRGPGAAGIGAQEETWQTESAPASSPTKWRPRGRGCPTGGSSRTPPMCWSTTRTTGCTSSPAGGIR